MTLCTITNALRCTCCGIDLSTATYASRCTFSSADLSLGHNPFRGVPAIAQIQPWAQALWDLPELAWAYSQLQMWLWIRQAVLLLHRFIHWSQSLQLEFRLEFQPVQYSSTETAAMLWLSSSPGTLPLLLSECSQAQQSKMISSTASNEAESSH